MDQFASPKSLFSFPDQVHYLNCATMSPLLRSVEAAGIEGIRRKSQPHTITAADFFSTIETVKSAFARLIGCSDAQRIAVMGSVSYGMATVAKNILKKGMIRPGHEIVMPGEEFPSVVYAWDELVEAGAKLRFVPAPESLRDRGQQWNEALLNAIGEHTLMVSLSPTHWSDGTLFDLKAIGQKCREYGALLVIDGTQHIGAAPFEINEIQADAVVAATYKWLLGPYSGALAWLGPWLDDGVPLEQNWAMRLSSDDFKNLIEYQPEYRPGAYRYNIGEMSNFILLPMITAALDQILAWTPSRIQAHARQLVTPFAADIATAGYWTEAPEWRSHHLFGIRPPAHVRMEDIQQALLQHHIYVSYRGSAIRVSVHLWNTPEELQLLAGVLKGLAQKQ